MSDSPTISRIARRTAEDERVRESDALCDDLGCLGWLRGRRDRALMLELRKCDGSILAIGYAWIERITYDPSEGIALHIPGALISVVGRNLNGGDQPVFEGLTRHRVVWLREAPRGQWFEDATGCFIERIDW